VHVLDIVPVLLVLAQLLHQRPPRLLLLLRLLEVREHFLLLGKHQVRLQASSRGCGLLMEWAVLVRLTVGFVFLGSSVAKLLRPSVLTRSLQAYPMIPGAVARPLAVVLTVAEGAIAIGLLAGVQPQVALLGSGILLALFAVVTAMTVRRKGPLDCGCLGGMVKLRLGWMSVVNNVLLSVLAVAAVAFAGDFVAAEGALAPQSWVVLWGSASLLAATYWLVAYAQSVTQLVAEAISREST
jgi:hypothetical protein